ncbi:MAG: signal peptidase I [Candidatus Woesearchaeota archaeon]
MRVNNYEISLIIITIILSILCLYLNYSNFELSKELAELSLNCSNDIFLLNLTRNIEREELIEEINILKDKIRQKNDEISKLQEFIIKYINNKEVNYSSNGVSGKKIYAYNDYVKAYFNRNVQIIDVLCTGSMRPTIDCGNKVIITKEFDYDDIDIGDIIIFKTKNTNLNTDLVLHRVIYKNETHLITKGDNNNVEDEPITYSQIKYLVLGIIY